MKNRILLSIAALLFLMPFALHAQAKSLLIGEWAFFDKDSLYHEVTITNQELYSFTAVGKWMENYPGGEFLENDISITPKSLIVTKGYFIGQKWTIIAFGRESSMKVKIDNNIIWLFKKHEQQDAIKSVMLENVSKGGTFDDFYERAKTRRSQLIKKMIN